MKIRPSNVVLVPEQVGDDPAGQAGRAEDGHVGHHHVADHHGHVGLQQRVVGDEVPIPHLGQRRGADHAVVAVAGRVAVTGEVFERGQDPGLDEGVDIGLPVPGDQGGVAAEGAIVAQRVPAVAGQDVDHGGEDHVDAERGHRLGVGQHLALGPGRVGRGRHPLLGREGPEHVPEVLDGAPLLVHRHQGRDGRRVLQGLDPGDGPVGGQALQEHGPDAQVGDGLGLEVRGLPVDRHRQELAELPARGQGPRAGDAGVLGAPRDGGGDPTGGGGGRGRPGVLAVAGQPVPGRDEADEEQKGDGQPDPPQPPHPLSLPDGVEVRASGPRSGARTEQ